jgi:hypothetical protein
MMRAVKRSAGTALLLLALVALAALALSAPGRRALRRLERAILPAASAPAGTIAVPMPALDSVATWIGGRPAAIAAGDPEVVVVYADTDPLAPELLPAIESWHQGYAGWGVRVVGLHRPQFVFATDSARAARAARRLALSFPIAHDPALLVPLPEDLPPTCALVGPAGGKAAVVVKGAASLAEADRWLRDRIRAAHPERRFPSDPPGAHAPPDRPRTRAIRLGAGEARDGPLADATPGVPTPFVTQTRFEEESRMWVPVPVGRWTLAGEGLVADRGGAANFLAIRYDAGRVSVVAGAEHDGPMKLWVLRDETWVPRAIAGADLRIDASGASYIEIGEPGLHDAIDGDRGVHVLKLSPEASGLTLHALTFEPPRAAPAARTK